MTAWYNEHDEKKAAWLRELIALGAIADGVVDTRSIEEIEPRDIEAFTQCHFFAGIGGWSYALRLAGWPDERPVWTGSCPCQSFSLAGQRKGDCDLRKEFHRLVDACRPPVVFGEQVASRLAVGRADGRPREGDGEAWVDALFDDLEASGYTCGAAILGAHSGGAPHIRQRLYWVADGDGAGRDRVGTARLHAEGSRGDDARGRRAHGRLADADGERGGRDARELHGATGAERQVGALEVRSGDHEPVDHGADRVEWRLCSDGKRRPLEPGIEPILARLPEGVVHRGDPIDPDRTVEARTLRLRGYGDAIVPSVAAMFVRAWEEVR